MDEDHPRTIEDVRLDLNYSMRLHELYARLFRRFRMWGVCITLLASAAAVTELAQKLPHGVLIAGLVITFIAVVDSQGRWEERAVRHCVLRKEYGKLLGDLPEKTYDEANRELVLIDVESDDELECMRLVAYNDAMRSNGLYSRVRKETICNRVMRLLT